MTVPPSLLALPPLPNVRPSSGNTASSRERSVQRLRAAVSEVRQGWTKHDAVGSPIGMPRPMIVRMPLRARTPAPTTSSSFGGGSSMLTSPLMGSSGGGNYDGAPSTSASSGVGAGTGAGADISPLPCTPYGLYTGDTPAIVASALCRGARIVRAHGLREPTAAEQPPTTQFYGTYGASGRGAPSMMHASSQQHNKQQQQQHSRRPSNASSSGSSRMSGIVDHSSGRAIPEDASEEVVNSRTQQLTSGDVKPLLEPRSIFFVPSLVDAGPSAAQMADVFTAGNSRRKLVSVMTRSKGNETAVRRLTKALKVVKEHEHNIEADKAADAQHHHAETEAAAAAAAAGGGEGASSSSPDASGGGGGDAAARRKKDKDPEVAATEAAVASEAERVRGAVMLLKDRTPVDSNRSALYTRFRRVLRVDSSGEFSMPSRSVLKVLADALDLVQGDNASLLTFFSTLPQWEKLAQEEIHAAEAAKRAKESRSHRRAKQKQQQQQQQDDNASSANVMHSPSGSIAGGPSTDGVNPSPSSGAVDEMMETSFNPDASFNPGASFNPDASFNPGAGPAATPSRGLGAELSGSAKDASVAAPLPLQWVPLPKLLSLKKARVGSALRDLVEEFVAKVLDPSKLTVARVLVEAQAIPGAPSSDIKAWQPILHPIEVSTLVDALQETLQGRLVHLVATSVFNFVRKLVDNRHKWTELCNGVEDVSVKVAVRSQLVAKLKAEESAHGESTTVKGGSSVHHHGVLGRSRSPATTSHHQTNSSQDPSGGGETTAKRLSPLSPDALVLVGGEPTSSEDVPDVKLPETFNVALISDRPDHMDEEFYDLEYIAFEEFAELQRMVHDRRHLAGFSSSPTDNADDEHSRGTAFSIVHSVCASMGFAFRHVLAEEQLAQMMAHSKKKKKIDINDLPPVFPNKSTVLRFKDLKRAFMTSEKVSGPLLSFCLGAYLTAPSPLVLNRFGLWEQPPLSPEAKASRWRKEVPIACFL